MKPQYTAPLDEQRMAGAFEVEHRTGLQWLGRGHVGLAIQPLCSHFLTADLEAGRLFGSSHIVHPFLPDFNPNTVLN